MTKWSQAFWQFFVDSIHPVVTQLGTWSLLMYRLMQQPVRIIQLRTEAAARLREAPLDSMALCLFRLSHFNVTEVRRGQCGSCAASVAECAAYVCSYTACVVFNEYYGLSCKYIYNPY